LNFRYKEMQVRINATVSRAKFQVVLRIAGPGVICIKPTCIPFKPQQR